MKARDLGLFIEAAVALVVAAAMVRFWPFPRVARVLALGGAQAGRIDAPQAAAVALAVERGARRIPLRLVCFQQGLACHWMLRRREIGSVLHYGLAKTDRRLAAHVWVTVGDETVIGGLTGEAYTSVAHFPA